MRLQTEKRDSARIYARSDTPLHDFFGALLCVVLAVLICLGGIYLMQRKGPSPRYSAERFPSAQQAEEAEGEGSGGTEEAGK